MRREIYPLARRLATRLAREQHARRRGPLDFRRTVRASISTGGVPLTTHHRPRRPHRTELVVLCDVSGSVANFAQFTLMLVFALREQFSKVRAFTFVDQVHEVTRHFRPGADPARCWPGSPRSDRARGAGGAARTTAARSPTSPSSTPTRSARSRRCSSSATPAPTTATWRCATLRDMADRARHAWWLNPEHRRHWDTGDSAAPAYGEVVPMVECRNLAQLGEFVHDLVLSPASLRWLGPHEPLMGPARYPSPDPVELRPEVGVVGAVGGAAAQRRTPARAPPSATGSWAASKTTMSRLAAPALSRDPSRATGSARSSSDSIRVPSGSAAPGPTARRR